MTDEAIRRILEANGICGPDDWWTKAMPSLRVLVEAAQAKAAADFKPRHATGEGGTV